MAAMPWTEEMQARLVCSGNDFVDFVSKDFREFTPSWKKRAGAVSAVGYTPCLTKSQPI